MIHSQTLPHTIFLLDHILGIQFLISLSTLSPAFQYKSFILLHAHLTAVWYIGRKISITYPPTFPDLYDKCLCPLLPSLKTLDSAKTCIITLSFLKAICKSTNLFKIEVLDLLVQQVYTLNYLAMKLPTIWNERCLDKVPVHNSNAMVKPMFAEVSCFIVVSQC